MKEKQTPLMRQYTQIKQKYPDTVLLYRLGDFFETFQDDAVITAKVCGIALTKRNNGAAGDMPLAGFPHHQLDNYLPKLVKAGYRVAVCEQLEDPKLARGIVKRGVTEVVTPGVALYDKLLDVKRNNYLASIHLHQDKQQGLIAGFALVDVTTGEFLITEILPTKLSELILSYSPAEIIISKKDREQLSQYLKGIDELPHLSKLEEWIFEYQFALDSLLKQFNTKNLKGFGAEDSYAGIIAAGAIIHYINETQKGNLSQIRGLQVHNSLNYMPLDISTRKNLEIMYSQSGAKEGTLISILDKTQTPMGGRLIRKWVAMPLLDLHQINLRLDAVEELMNDSKRNNIKNILSHIGDLERLISKVCSNRANPRDLVQIKNSLVSLKDIKKALTDYKSELISQIRDSIVPLDDLVMLITNAIKDEPSTAIGSGNIFRKGFSPELDDYINAKTNSKQWIQEYQEQERTKSGINSLKVGFNNVFGYYIDVTRIHSNKVPSYYDRKQTLANSERYTTPELKDMESKIFTAEEKIGVLESELFNTLLENIANFTQEIQNNAHLAAKIDSLQSFAQASSEYNYVKPEITENTELNFVDSRHPVIEKMLPVGVDFTPNSTEMNTQDNVIHIITGPNMSGKSCYLRQTALVVMMGQIGCYVPAKSAKFGIVDRIFTRVGAQDNIATGESTFLVEMQEAANILNNATEKSLILLDEVGRGTATFDGISIAWAIAEYIHEKIKAKTLFATHYHELNDLAERYSGIVNYKVEVFETGSDIVFTHKVSKGASDHSFGIHVAKMAGMPYYVVERANEIMQLLEDKSDSSNKKAEKTPKIERINTKKAAQNDQLAIFEFRDDELRDRLKALKINNITPVQALQILSDLHTEAKK